MAELISIRAGYRHCVLETLIKQLDPSPNTSRSDVFRRAVVSARGVTKWKELQSDLCTLDKCKEDVPIFSSYQVRLDDGTIKILAEVKNDILSQLKGGIKVLQTRYLVQLLLINYLNTLQQEKISLRENIILDETDISLPEMSKILTEMMLIDKGCAELGQIRTILAAWKNKYLGTSIGER